MAKIFPRHFWAETIQFALSMGATQMVLLSLGMKGVFWRTMASIVVGYIALGIFSSIRARKRLPGQTEKISPLEKLN